MIDLSRIPDDVLKAALKELGEELINETRDSKRSHL